MTEYSVSEESDDVGAAAPAEVADVAVVADVAGGVLAVLARLRVALGSSGLQGMQAAGFQRVEEELLVLEEQVRAQELQLRRWRDRKAAGDHPAGSGSDVRGLRALATMAGLSIVSGDLRRVMHSVAVLSAEAVRQPGQQAWASVIMGSPHAPELLTCSSQHAQHLEGLQLTAGQGPGFQAIHRAQVVTSPDLRTDPRWPRLCAKVDLDPTFCIAAPLLVDDRPAGVLSVYGAAGAAPMRAEAIDLVTALAIGAQTLLQEAQAIEEITRTRDQFQEALITRAVIDQAKGMIMMTQRCDPEEAFRYLVRVSNTCNQKLRELAASMVARGCRGLDPILPPSADATQPTDDTDQCCQVGGPDGTACHEPAEMKLTDSWGDTAWSCLNHAEDALLAARGVFLATKDTDGLDAYLTRRRRSGHSEPSTHPTSANEHTPADHDQGP